MEKFQEARARAKKSLKVADHMLTITYPLVQDPKLLLAVLENIFIALTNSMAAILYYERLFKRIPPFHDTFESKFNVFSADVSKKYKFDPSYIRLIMDVKNLILEHKKSPVEFSRDNKFVICSDKYDIKTISEDQLKEYVKKTKLFIQEMTNMVSKDESLFR